MEARKSTTAGLVFWTPAPVRSSSSSSISEDVWEDEEEEQAEQEDDFVSQMDENGIIGLCEALGELGGVFDAECDPDLPLPSEETVTPAEELSHHLSEHLSLNETQREDMETPSPPGADLFGNLKAWTVEEEEKDGEEARTDRKRNKKCNASRTGTTNDFISKADSEDMLAMQRPISKPASPVKTPAFPHLRHFTAEEMTAAPGIEAEPFPELSFIESLPESLRSHMSHKSSPRCPEARRVTSSRPAAMSSEEVVSHHYSGVSNGALKGSYKSEKHQDRPTPSPRKTRPDPPVAASRSLIPVGTGSSKHKGENARADRHPGTPGARSSVAEGTESRKGPQSYGTPDFSKVEPKVHFPKSGYKPPKSRRSRKRESLSPEPPLVFKSPADIVKEILLNIPDGFPLTPDTHSPAESTPDFTVPQEFRCPRHATMLLEQLQEDYHTLLTKYAEAENTIDRLRLEAKVSLYSDPPKPGLVVQSALKQEPSGFMTLDFPQAQRVEINSAPLYPNGHCSRQQSSSASPSPRSPHPQDPAGQQPAKVLYNHADRFLQQLQTFEDLLKRNKVKPSEQMKGVSQFAEGLDSLERGYLLVRDEHKVLQQRGAESSRFDPERELEGLIFQCGLRLDELKEQVEQREQPIREAPPSPSPHPSTLSVPSERREILTPPQSPPEPSLADPGEAAAARVSSASEETEDEETLYLKPDRSVEQDFATVTDHCQSFKELPELSDPCQGKGAPRPAASLTRMHPEDEETERPSQETGNQQVQKSVPQRKSDHEDSPPLQSSNQRISRSSPPSGRASTPLSVEPPSTRKRFEVGKSHSSSLSSLGDIAALERRRSSKLQTGSSRVLSQDGIISPETDSGFVGSESSHLTPAAAPSPLHQRAAESVSLPREGNPDQPQAVLVSAAPSPTSSPLHRCAATELGGGSLISPDQPRRTRREQRRRPASSSPQHWLRQTKPSTADSGTSDFGLESDSIHTVSEERHNDLYPKSVSPLHSPSPSSSPAAQHRHGDSFQAQTSSQVANRNDAIQTLQAEVSRMKEAVERCLRSRKQANCVGAAQETYARHRTSTPRLSSEERWSDVSGGRRDAEDSTLRPTARKSPPSAPRQKPQPDTSAASERSTPRPRPLVSRCTQTSTSHTSTGHSRTHSRQQQAVFAQGCETPDEPDSRSHQACLCPQCLSRHRGRPARPAGGPREPTPTSCCRHCPLCCPTWCRSTEPGQAGRSTGCLCHSPPRMSRQPAESQDRGARSRVFAAAAPPELLQCVQPPLLLYSSPLYASPSNSTGTSLRVGGRTEERRRRRRRSLSADRPRSVDGSLIRAIRAARRMKLTSGHMARSLATGLHYQELLTQS